MPTSFPMGQSASCRLESGKADLPQPQFVDPNSRRGWRNSKLFRHLSIRPDALAPLPANDIGGHQKACRKSVRLHFLFVRKIGTAIHGVIRDPGSNQIPMKHIVCDFMSQSEATPVCMVLLVNRNSEATARHPLNFARHIRGNLCIQGDVQAKSPSHRVKVYRRRTHEVANDFNCRTLFSLTFHFPLRLQLARKHHHVPTRSGEPPGP